MLLISGFKNIEFGETYFPEEGLPYVNLTILPKKEIIQAGSVIWDVKEKRWEIRSREETKEMVKKMEGKNEN